MGVCLIHYITDMCINNYGKRLMVLRKTSLVCVDLLQRVFISK